MAVIDQLKAIPISEFHQCYEEWKKRHQRCVASGDNVELNITARVIESWHLWRDLLLSRRFQRVPNSPMTPKWSQKSPNWPPKMKPTGLYRQDFAKFSLNRHYNVKGGIACE
ncbi:hypothetical protein TNCV_322561 [Trichonephila clavipes]|nr:hypothetical protein TNCV_322561 [Trichonephila clavipes]